MNDMPNPVKSVNDTLESPKEIIQSPGDRRWPITLATKVPALLSTLACLLLATVAFAAIFMAGQLYTTLNTAFEVARSPFPY